MNKLSRMMADMDREYNPKKIADDLKRDEEENAEWYRKMRSVKKPRNIVLRHQREDNFRRGVYIEQLPVPLYGEVIVKLEPITHELFELSIHKHKESPIVLVAAVNPRDRGAYNLNDRVVIDANKYLNSPKVWTNTIRFNLNSEIYILVVAKDILAVIDGI